MDLCRIWRMVEKLDIFFSIIFINYNRWLKTHLVYGIKLFKANILKCVLNHSKQPLMRRTDFTLTQNFVWHHAYVKPKRSKHKPVIYISYLIPWRGGRIFEKYFEMTEKGTFKKENMKEEYCYVARTGKCADIYIVPILFFCF